VTQPAFKLDENLDQHVADILREAGYQAATVKEQGLRGASDREIAEVCRREGRCLISLDLHFPNIIDLPPGDYDGIVVLRHPRLRLPAVLQLARQLVGTLRGHDPKGQLWIVEPGRTRMHIPQAE
jgi:predicted nuclease of predicted toxin-antitoxin system